MSEIRSLSFTHQFIYVQDNLYIFTELADALDKCIRLAAVETRCGFDLARRNIHHFTNGIHHQAHGRIMDIDHHNASPFIVRARLQMEAHANIHYRDYFSTQVDHPFDVIGHFRDHGDLLDSDNLRHKADFDSIVFGSQMESKEFVLLGIFILVMDFFGCRSLCT